jgi:hypothetical protein
MDVRGSNFILRLAEDKRQQFDDMLRRNGYGGTLRRLNGFVLQCISSRTALSRYSALLRKRDGVTEGAAGSYHVRTHRDTLKRISENDIQWMQRVEAKLDRLLELLEKDKA